MLTKWLILSLLVMGLVSLLYFRPLSVDKTLPDRITERDRIDLLSNDTGIYSRDDGEAAKSSDSEITGYPLVGEPAPGNAEDVIDTTRRFEIYGRIIDEYNQPIEGVLVSEDRYWYSTRSNSDGQYRLALELPKLKYSMLTFERAGYRADRVGVSTEDLKIDARTGLNITLAESSDSVKLGGWISNDIGESLPGQKIRISSWGYQGQDSIIHTVLSDEKGEFVFEAVRPDINYRLEVFPSPDYAPYSIEELSVTRTPPRLNISLRRLKFIQISGMFVDSGGNPVPNFEIDIKNLTTGIHVRKIVSDSSGFFNLEKFPAGKMRFSGSAPEFFDINGLSLSENEYRNLILVVDRGIYQLSGWVSDQNGVAVSGARVTLDAEIVSDGIQSISIRSAVTDSMGRFEFDQLGDVEHVITVYAKGFETKELLHRFQSSIGDVQILLDRQ
ncbi:MAG: carboxypeptidase-like regulatory domain-containing protein [Gammaproteobacteria bacterium]